MLKNLSVSGYRSTAIAAHLGVSRQAISALAKRYGWKVEMVIGREKIYSAPAVEEYLAARRRTPLLKKLGAKILGLSWSDTPDGECPICGGFAAFWHPSQKIYGESPSAHWACENGHSSFSSKEGE